MVPLLRLMCNGKAPTNKFKVWLVFLLFRTWFTNIALKIIELPFDAVFSIRV